MHPIFFVLLGGLTTYEVYQKMDNKPKEQTFELCNEFDNNIVSANGKYELIIENLENDTYIPNKRYNSKLLNKSLMPFFYDFVFIQLIILSPFPVFLLSTNRLNENRSEFTKFFIGGNIEFIENKCKKISYPTSGTFSPIDDQSIINVNYTNTLSEMDENTKPEVKAVWIAPKTGSICVYITAIPFYDGMWYSDPVKLEKLICEQNDQ